MPKFSSYSTIAGASVASGDYALILDVSDTTLGSTGTQKKITITELATALGTSALSFSTFAVAGQSNVVADSSSDTLTLAAGSNITITTDASTDTITIAAAGGSSLPVADSTAIVKGSSDATKQVRLEVDGLTSGTTRVLTIPDADGTLPLLGLAQTWTSQQTHSADIVVSGNDTNIRYSGLGNIILGDMLTSNVRRNLIAKNDSIIKAQSPDTCCMVAADYAAGDARWQMRSETGGDVWIGNGTVTGLSSPTASGDAATKGYVDTAVTGLLDFKGATDASGNPNYPAASKGDCYVVSVAGKIGGASGKSVDIGDVYLATADNAGGDEGTVGTSWTVLEHNLVGALLSANNLSDLASASTARTNLGLGTAALKATGTSGNTVPLLDGANSWSGQQGFAQSTLTSSSNHVAWDASTAQTAGHTLTENTTLDDPTNLTAGFTYIIEIIQHASSAKTLAFGANYRFSGSSTISTTVSSKSLLTCYYDGTHLLCSLTGPYS